MRKVGLIFIGVLLSLYVVLHLLLGSSPIQKRVLSEIRKAIYEFGLDLEIESIEFSAFAPRIYLNRVTLKPTPKFDIPLPEPLTVDKIKIEFQPLALLYKEIHIQEIALFYPRVLIPQADRLYKKLTKLIEEKKKMMVKGGDFNVVFKRLGLVDALFEVKSSDPDFAVRSRSFTFFIEQNTSGQQTVTIFSKNLEFDRGPLRLKLRKTDLDIDLTANSVRVNHATLDGDNISVNLKGASSLPAFAGKKDDSFWSEYDITLPIALLKDIPEIKFPPSTGIVSSKGSVNISKSQYSGSGSIRYENLKIDGYDLNVGESQYELTQKRAILKDLRIKIGAGEISSPSMTVEFENRYNITGDLKISKLQLTDLLKTLKSEDPTAFAVLNGGMKVTGTLKPFEIDVALKPEFRDLYVLDKLNKPRDMENTIVETDSGSVDGHMRITEAGIGLQATAKTLEGQVVIGGTIGFDNRVSLKLDAQNLSLTKLGHIAEVPFAGVITNLKGALEVKGDSGHVGGDFEIQNGEVANIALGAVKGKVFYQDKLLSFARLELPSLEPVTADGYLDFRPKKNHYLFNVTARRALIDQIFSLFRKMKLDFPKPVGGETSARVTIEGGHDANGVEVKANGTARGFEWYNEKWLSSNFSFTYRIPFVDIHRASFLKRSGALDVRARFEGPKTFLALSSQGMRLEEFNYFGKAPISGDLSGNLRLEGDLNEPAGNGDIQVTKARFRGVAIPDSNVRIRTKNDTTEFLASVAADKFRVRLLRQRESSKKHRSDLLVYFKDFDFMPMLSVFMGKDISSLGGVKATGDVALQGIWGDFGSLKGSGSVTNVELGLKSGPMKNERPIHVAMGDGVIKVDRFRLLGSESQISMDFYYDLDKNIRGNLDGKLDLEYLQAFIPGCEFGIGQVGVNLRLSGPPKQFSLLGNVSLRDGTFRLTGLSDEFKNAEIQLSVSQDRINVNRFFANLGSGEVTARGDIAIDRFRKFAPNISLSASQVSLKTRNFLTTKFSGNFTIKGNETPYLFSGRSTITEAKLTDFNVGDELGATSDDPVFNFDIKGEADDKIFVTTDVMDAEFKGNLNLVGNTNDLALLGNVEGIRGSILFKETKFTLDNATVKFEEPHSILPRFNVSGRAVVREQRTNVPTDYEVHLQVFGTPKDYKIRLTSVPSLPEPELISLLVLGVTTRQEGNYIDLGSVIAGQTPFQSRIQSELGVDIRMGTQTGRPLGAGSVSGGTTGGANAGDVTVPSVKIQKSITKKTKLSYSTTVGEEIPYKEFRIEHLLNENFTVNGTAMERLRGTQTDPVKSYGLDVRYHFTFE